MRLAAAELASNLGIGRSYLISASFLVLTSVVGSAHEVQRNVRLVSHHPTVVTGWNIKHVPGMQFEYASIIHRRGGTTCKHHAYMLHVTPGGTRRLADMLGPLPSRIVGGTTNRHVSDLDQLELAFFETAGLVRILESFQDDVARQPTDV